MSVFNCTLGPEAVVRIHDAVLCLARFSDTVGLQVHHDRLTLSSLNSSKSSYASFSLLKDDFFQTFLFRPERAGAPCPQGGEPRFMCQLYNKALLSVFKGRIIDARDKDTSIEKCEINIQDRPNKTECRLVVKMICRHGVKKTYKLTYESEEVRHAVFIKTSAKSKWTVGANVLKSFCEYFGAKTEQLDLHYENERFTFVSYTEKIMNGNEILRQPLQTSITIDRLDFEDFSVEEKVHIGISVKDFKTIVTHAETLKTAISAHYSCPAQPMQLTYGEHGMKCEFILMCIGESRGGSVVSVAPVPRAPSARPSTRSESVRPPTQETSQRSSAQMLPPLQPASRSFIRAAGSQRPFKPSPPPPPASVPHESLFIPADDNDSLWGERNYDEEEEEDELGWGASADKGSHTTSLHRSSMTRLFPARTTPDNALDENERRVPPTQRISQISGLFDD